MPAAKRIPAVPQTVFAYVRCRVKSAALPPSHKCECLIVTVFVSLLLVVGGLILFVSRLRGGDFEHGDRLSLLPLAEDTRKDPVTDGDAGEEEHEGL